LPSMAFATFVAESCGQDSGSSDSCVSTTCTSNVGSE